MSPTPAGSAGASPESRGFADRLAPADRAALLAIGHPRRYPAGAYMFHEGDQGMFAALITRGRVKVVGFGADGTEIIHGFCGPGDLVGELAVIDEAVAQRSATAIAVGPVDCQILLAAELLGFFEAHPRATLEVVRTLAARLRYASRRRAEHGTFGIDYRVARLLVDLVETYGHTTGEGVQLGTRFSQAELASLVGASRESIVRALTTLRREGLIATSRRSIVIRDLQRLRSYRP